MDRTDEFTFVLKPSTIQNAGIGVFATHPINQATLIRVAPKYARSRRLKSHQIPDAFKVILQPFSGHCEEKILVANFFQTS